VLEASLAMLGPFSPFIAEEAYRALPTTDGSVHATQWPTLDETDETAEYRGELIAAVTREVRAWKSDTGRALNAGLERIEVYADDTNVTEGIDTYDLSEAVSAPIYIESGRPNVDLVPVGIDPDHSVIGPEFRNQAGAVIDALEAMDPEAIDRQKTRTGEIELALDDGEEIIALDGEAVAIREEPRADGEEVAVLEPEGATVLVFP
jgi:valyl-tRNA synthetase